MIQEKSLKKNVILNLLKALMGVIFPLISFPYVSRILMPEGIGKVNFANSFVDYFLIIATLGITSYATREAAKIKNNKKELSIFFKEILYINCISTFIAIIIFIISFSFIPLLIPYKKLLLICAIKLLFSPIILEWLYTAEEEFSYITVRSCIFQFCSIILMLLFVKEQNHFLIYAAIGIFSNVGISISNLCYAQKFIDFNEKVQNLKKHIKPILIFFGSSCAARVQNAIDSVMLGFLSGDIELGFYSAATKLVKITGSLLTTITATLLPRTSFYIQNKENDKFNLLIYKTINLTVFISLPICVGLIILSNPLILVFSGEHYLPARAAMLIITPTIIFAAIGSLVDTIIFIPNKKEKLTLIFQIINCIINIILNMYFIKKFGAFGAAISTMLVELLNMLLKICFSLQYFLCKCIFINLIKTLFSTAVMYFAVYFTLNISKQVFYNIILSFSVGCITYALISFLLKHESSKLILSIIFKNIYKE